MIAAQSRTISSNEKGMHIHYAISVNADVSDSYKSFKARANEISIWDLKFTTTCVVRTNVLLEVFLDLSEPVMIKGIVEWVLSSCGKDRLITYEVGLRINQIKAYGLTASGMAARSEMISEILLSLKKNGAIQ